MRYRSFGMVFTGLLLGYYFLAVGVFPAVARLFRKVWKAVMAEAEK